jgi:hypothetical protein
VIARILVSYEDDNGVPMWHFSRAEAVPLVGDAEQNILTARASLAEGLKQATAAISAHADRDLESARKEAKEAK